MGRKLSPDQKELYRRCDEVLHYIWDPIGVAGVPGARDEYEAYLPRVFELVHAESASSSIVDYLVEVQTGAMGLSADRSAAEAAAEALQEWREWIDEFGS